MKRLDPPRRNRKWSVKAKRRTHNSWGVFWWRVYWLFNFCTILVWTLYNFESFWLNKYNFSSHFKFFIQSAVYLLKKFKKNLIYFFYPGEIVTVSAATRWPGTTISSLSTSVRQGLLLLVAKHLQVNSTLHLLPLTPPPPPAGSLNVRTHYTVSVSQPESQLENQR